MNNYLHTLHPVLDRLARRSKILLFLVIFALVSCSMLLSMGGVIGAEKDLVESAGPILIAVTVTAAIAEIAASMVRFHLK